MKKTAILIAIALAATLAHGATAFLKGERTSGMTKICYYEFAGNEYAITVRSFELCPLNIRTN